MRIAWGLLGLALWVPHHQWPIRHQMHCCGAVTKDRLKTRNTSLNKHFEQITLSQSPSFNHNVCTKRPPSAQLNPLITIQPEDIYNDWEQFWSLNQHIHNNKTWHELHCLSLLTHGKLFYILIIPGQQSCNSVLTSKNINARYL